MAGEWQHNFLWGTAAALFAGVYGLVGKHLLNHMRKKDMEDVTTSLQEHREEYKRLLSIVQYRDNCSEIVRRQDEAHTRTHELLRDIDKKVDKLTDKMLEQ